MSATRACRSRSADDTGDARRRFAKLERGITIDLDVASGLSVLAEDDLITSVVGNLLHNAIKFSHDDAHVVLRAWGERAYVHIEVEDACGGLPPGPHEAMFEPFVQKGATAAASASGWS